MLDLSEAILGFIAQVYGTQSEANMYGQTGLVLMKWPFFIDNIQVDRNQKSLVLMKQ